MSLVRKTLNATVKAESVDVKNRTIDVVFSNETIDRDGEILLLSGWEKRLDTYRANPLVLWHHPLSEGGAWDFRTAPDPDRTMGKALSVQVEAGVGLWGKLQYAVDINPKAKMVFELLAGGYLRSYSIGAISHACAYADYPEQFLSLLPQFVQDALKSGDAWCVHTDMELLELSNVFVGSCRDSLARACRDGIIKAAEMPELFRQINAGRPRLIVPKTIKEEDVTDAQFKQLSGMIADLSGKVSELTTIVTTKSAEGTPEPESESTADPAPATEAPDPAAETPGRDIPAEPTEEPAPAPTIDVETTFAGILQAALAKL